MKKIFSMALVACMAALVITSCKKDEPTPTPTPEPEQDTKAVAAAIVFNATFDPQTIEQCDISFDYYDEKGNKKNEVVTTTEWSKKIQTAALPATLGFHWNLAVKANLDETKYEHFVVDAEFSYASASLNASGAAVKENKVGPFGSHISMAIAKRDAVVTSIMNNKPINVVHKYDAEGKLTSEDWK